MTEGLDLLDDIGLILSVFILLFISYFHLRDINDERTWDRKMGASLVIWLLLYFILERLQTFDSLGMTITSPDVSGTIVDVASYASTMNYYYTHLFLMLLVPIPFLRKSWQIGAIGIIVIVLNYIDRDAQSGVIGEVFYNSMLLTCLTMVAALVCFSIGLRFLLFPPPLDADDIESLVMRRSGFFALGTISVVMNNFIFRSIGFLDGSDNAWWTLPIVNWSPPSGGYFYGMVTLAESAFILGAFSFIMLSFALGGIYHLIQTMRGRHPVSLATVFSGYILLMWSLIIFRHWAFVTGYGEWAAISGLPVNDNAIIISALSDGFAMHLIYPTIALLHAVKFGLITIESERDKKIFRIVALGVMVAITAVFTSLLEIIIPVPDIVLAVLCGLVLATGWERYLIDALEPDEEMKNVSWAWPGNERGLMWTINLMIGIPFAINLLTGVIW
tara:strand:- start:325 stop:1659 length:1335 start_codon:yes stop_codon:yes gene_type:complete